jgi:hypothetical protein
MAISMRSIFTRNSAVGQEVDAAETREEARAETRESCKIEVRVGHEKL